MQISLGCRRHRRQRMMSTENGLRSECIAPLTVRDKHEADRAERDKLLLWLPTGEPVGLVVGRDVS